MNRRTGWTVGFLAVTALAIGMELFAIRDGNPDTQPWTDLVVDHLPEEGVYALIGALLLWLPIHFWRKYRKRERQRR